MAVSQLGYKGLNKQGRFVSILFYSTYNTLSLMDLSNDSIRNFFNYLLQTTKLLVTKLTFSL